MIGREAVADRELVQSALAFGPLRFGAYIMQARLWLQQAHPPDTAILRGLLFAFGNKEALDAASLHTLGALFPATLLALR